MKRRQLLRAACTHCAGLLPLCAFAEATDDWVAPGRFDRPDLNTDEGGLWAMMDREESRMRRSPFILREAALREYLQGIVTRLAGPHAPDVRVYAVRTPYFNASMAPNGMMQVWTGLLLRVENEAQLAAVLGHELGHYLQRHLLERLRDARSRSAFGMFLGMFGIVGLIGQLGVIAGAFGFSRDQERDADRLGLILLRRAGYDTREAGKIWDNLRAEMAANPSNDAAKSSPMFATHPASDERSATLARLSAADSGGFLGDKEFRDHLEAFQFDMLDDELKRGQHAESLALLDRLHARAPDRADLLFFRGEVRRLRASEGDLVKAEADLTAAVGLGHEPPQAHRSLGYLHRKQSNLTQARQAFLKYLELAPQAPDAALIRTYLNEETSPS